MSAPWWYECPEGCGSHEVEIDAVAVKHPNGKWIGLYGEHVTLVSRPFDTEEEARAWCLEQHRIDQEANQ